MGRNEAPPKIGTLPRSHRVAEEESTESARALQGPTNGGR